MTDEILIEDNGGKKLRVKVPLETWIQNIAEAAGRQAARTVIREHSESCPAVGMVPVIKENKRYIESDRRRWIFIFGIMLGCGLTGGGAAFSLMRFFGL